MKRIILLVYIMLLQYPAFAQQEKGFALIELFTSEGCSSCPPADKLAAATIKEYEGKNVFVLAYHVDYWNRLGWKDVYSAHEWSTRQEQYANLLGLSSVYTPQMIVNGRTEFTGSDSHKLHAAINASLSMATQNTIALNTTAQNKSIAVTYSISGNISGKHLEVALIQKNSTSTVKAGENAGSTLRHVNIVRNLNTITTTPQTGHVIINLPAGLSAAECSIIAFLQSADGTINAATLIQQIK
ncbi:MAG: DUF1223 domain-containing protein [Flavipsychrobacter sp.]|nr:DUF1223 domain-containing protein [Flavipsychrobacter sp.]